MGVTGSSKVGAWSLVASADPADATSTSFTGLSAHDLWMMVLRLQVTHLDAVNANDQLGIRINDISGTDYEIQNLDDAAVGSSTGQTAFWLGTFVDVAGADYNSFLSGAVYIGGRSFRQHSTGNFIVGPVSAAIGGLVLSTVLADVLWSGYYLHATVDPGDITRIDLVRSGTAIDWTGEVELYHAVDMT